MLNGTGGEGHMMRGWASYFGPNAMEPVARASSRASGGIGPGIIL
jgi:hypothetical protein